MAKLTDGAVSTDCPGNILLRTFEELECVNSETIMQVTDKELSLLWPQTINHNKVLLFVTDASSYIAKAAKYLEMLHPRMIHITCMAHKSSMKGFIFFIITTRLYTGASPLSRETVSRLLLQ